MARNVREDTVAVGRNAERLRRAAGELGGRNLVCDAAGLAQVAGPRAWRPLSPALSAAAAARGGDCFHDLGRFPAHSAG